MRDTARDEKILRASNGRKTYRQIALELGVTPGVVNGVLNRHGAGIGRRRKDRLPPCDIGTIDIFRAAASVDAAKAMSRVEAPDVERVVEVSAAPTKKSREPTRYAAPQIATGEALPAFFGMAPDIDPRQMSPGARAVLAAKSSTCRFVLNQPAFAFCGRPATVPAAGLLTYCAACAERMYQPDTRPALKRTGRSASDRHFIGG